MDTLIIDGGVPLKGEVKTCGSKNAALPVMAATLLAKGKFHLKNVPDLRDIASMAHLLRVIGARIDYNNHEMLIDTTDVSFFEAPYELVKTMRASIYVLGPLVGKYGKARVSLPGGCAWGPRPVNFHLEGIKKLGAEVVLDKGYIDASAGKLQGSTISFDIPSVGATGNLLMAAVMAEGQTVFENAAREPEITALIEFLIKMGADIQGAGTSHLVVNGVKELHPADYEIIPDRIEALTYMIAGIITGGDLKISTCNPGHFTEVIDKVRDTGVDLEVGDDFVHVKGKGKIKPVNVETAVYPGFPTDAQAQWTVMMALADGSTVVTDNIYHDRFAHVPELNRLGADIQVKNNSVFIHGVDKLTAAPVMSTDLRASASLVLGALAAEGETTVHRVYHLDRGYEKLEKKLEAVGAKIRRGDDGKYY